MKIPTVLHQVHTKGLNGLAQQEKDAILQLKQSNPDWAYQFYNYYDMVQFIRQHYAERYLNAFFSIDSRYAAAQVDYFRYLLIYKVGGAYFDVKSYTIRPLNDLILDTDELLCFEWQGGTALYEDWGVHDAIVRKKEYQQWNIIASPGNRFLEHVIERVTQNIEQYTSKKFGVSAQGVFNTTGPIPYTNAIDEIAQQNTQGFRCLGSSCQNGLIFRDLNAKRFTHSNHYSFEKGPIIKQNTQSWWRKLFKA